RKNLLTRSEAQTDRRYQDISLTRTGSELVPKLARLADRNDAEFFGVLSAAERKTLLEILKKMASRHQLKRLPLE
ncbi:MAG TPA: hypothetical protein VID71_08060, partial [Steroidobacteraceae bacterium]